MNLQALYYMTRFRPVTLFTRYSPQALCDYAMGITKALTGNADFTTPSVPLATQATITGDFQASILAWGPQGNRGSRADHAVMMALRRDVEEMIRNLCGYVDGIAAGDRRLIMSSGMVSSAEPMPIGVLEQPQNLRSLLTDTLIAGQCYLLWKPVRGAASYVIFTATAPGAPWVYVSVSTKASFIASGDPGALRYFMVQAVSAAGPGVSSVPMEVRFAF